jgi:20S proteasome alpha/beta subunit
MISAANWRHNLAYACFLQPPAPQPIITPMTVGIAAICDGGNAIVMAADRLVSVGVNDLEAELGAPKLIPITPRVVVAPTGTIQNCEFVRERLQHTASLVGTMSVFSIAKKLRASCEAMRKRQVEYHVTRPIVGMSFAEFSKAAMNSPNSPGVAEVLREVQKHLFELALLLAGIDEYGAHLYCVQCTSIDSYGAFGYSSVGRGHAAATASLASRRIAFQGCSVAQTIYYVYAAKRSSESVNAVGEATDMVVIRKGKEAEFLKPEHLDVLKRIHKRMKPPELPDSDAGDIDGFFR